MSARADMVRQRFSAEAREWSRVYGGPPSRSIYAHNLHCRRRAALGLLGTQDGRVLEVGCGSGNVILSFPAGNGTRRFGTDFAVPMLRQARENAVLRNERLSILASDVHRLPFRDGVFVGVLCLGLLEYAEDVAGVLAECHRILEPGGGMVLSIPNGASPFIRLDDAAFGVKNAVTRRLPASSRGWLKSRLLGRQDRTYFNSRKHRFQPRKVGESLDELGFDVEETRYHTYGLGLLNGIGLNVRLSRHLESRARHRGGLERFGWTCILKAVKR